MNRRTFLLFCTATSAALAPSAWAMTPKTIDYTPGSVEQALAEGKTVFLDFSASWCSTCARQERVIEALRAENPSYESMVFFRVDWDRYRSADLTKKLGIPRRSTLVVLEGSQEIGRIVAGTSKGVIKELMDKGLASATS